MGTQRARTPLGRDQWHLHCARAPRRGHGIHLAGPRLGSRWQRHQVGPWKNGERTCREGRKPAREAPVGTDTPRLHPRRQEKRTRRGSAVGIAEPARPEPGPRRHRGSGASCPATPGVFRPRARRRGRGSHRPRRSLARPAAAAAPFTAAGRRPPRGPPSASRRDESAPAWNGTRTRRVRRRTRDLKKNP